MEKKDNKTTKLNKSNSKKVTKKDVKKVVESKDAVKVPEEEIIIKKITEKKERKIKVCRRDIIIAVIFVVIGAVVSFLIFKRAPRLKNGEQVAVSINKYSVSEQDIYNDIRTNNGLNSALRMIDLQIVKNYYKGSKDEEAQKNAEEQAETYVKQYTNYGYTEDQFYAYYGFENKEAFIEVLKGDYLLNSYFEDALKDNVSDDEINSYYEKYGIGKKVVYIFSEKNSTENLDKIRASLKKGTSIDKIVSKYEKNTSVVMNPKAEIDYSSISSYSDEVASYVKKTNASSYSKIFNDSVLGNVFVYVDSAEETPSKDDIKSEIVNAIVEKKKTDDGELYFKTFIEERKKNNIKFFDDAYSKQYDKYVESHTKSQDNK